MKAGMFARITLSAGLPYQATLVPKDAVVFRGGAEFVMVVNDGVVTQVPIQSGQHVDHSIAVMSDELSHGMNVVVEGNERLWTNQPVTILQ